MKRSIGCLFLVLLMAFSGGAGAFDTEGISDADFGAYGLQAYDYLRHIDGAFPDRDCVEGENFLAAQGWIISTLKACGYGDDQIRVQDFSFNSEGGKSRRSQNIIATLPGLSPTQIIIGAHYDGEGAGDNASGVAVLLEAAGRLAQGGPPPHTLVFAFFSAEEYDTDGSAAYAEAMSESDVSRTAFMINLDSLICGDYCYLYGGVADFDKETVREREAFDKVYGISQALGLPIRMIPWTYEHPAPGFETPDYPSPATGDWSDHWPFSQRGIQYVYFEASNWTVPGPDKQYDGDSETEEAGRIMHTGDDHVDRIEALFPGRTKYHLQLFSLLLHAVLTAP
ncbi:MAG: M28 family metallopeptidase [Christensenellales bacterium]